MRTNIRDRHVINMAIVRVDLHGRCMAGFHALALTGRAKTKTNRLAVCYQGKVKFKIQLLTMF